MEGQQVIISENVATPEDQPDIREGFIKRNIQIRYILALMGFYCFFVLSALRLNISIGIVAMVNWSVIKKDLPPEAVKEECHYEDTGLVRKAKEDGPFLWDPDTQGHILSSYFYGLASTQLLGGRLSELLSAKYVLLIGTLLATIANSLIPALAVAFPSGYAVMVLQVFKGFGQGIMMPSFSVLMGKWVPPTERARFMSVIASGIPVGGFFTVVISGILCHSPAFGWECYCLCLVYPLGDTDLRLAFEPSIHHKARTESDHVFAHPKSSYYRKHKKLRYRLGCKISKVRFLNVCGY
ncbi:hypothetical protein TNCT_595911 [Trichonephila clavata]|uniref:Major facilitator superfamily (MFS) profile domain-containing protein n=1 Tax=Trichonephila clavata TaxID=2740835 RepID=A0A8X6KQ27_TRICU|nr:hypothetical protein TNCT_595911 [Trichonephila clavata]